MLLTIKKKISDSESLAPYRPMPFWSWNGDLEPKQLKEQIHWMHEHGIGGFFMHARNGLKTEYLSEDWMNCVRVCCEEAKKLGMEAWGYDENGFPSGFAGGKLLEEEANHDMCIEFQSGIYDENADVSYRITEDYIERVKRSKCRAESGNEDVFLNLYLKTNPSTADILNPAVTDGFLRETHEQYRKYFGRDFSGEMKGFFTDEPEYYRYQTPYTPMVAQYFREHYHEDIMDGLGLLFVEKEGYRGFRYRYWKAMQQLMLQNFAVKVYGWCETHGVKLTGHYIEESSMGMQLWCCGGVMPFYEWEHIPGIDWLGIVTDNELPVRQVGSVAAQLGKKQVLTESFALTGWNITPSELRRIVGFQFTGGVNLLCHHLFPYSEHGVRKQDYPAHFSKVNPWIEDSFEEFNTYFTRLGYLLAEGEEGVNVALLHPMRSAYLEYKRETDAELHGIKKLEDSLQEVCRILSSRGISYHFLDETLLEEHGFVEENRIGCGRCAYTYLVLPQVLTMGRRTEELIRQFVMQGGRVLLMEGKPEYLEGEPYGYEYMESNCELQEIMSAQPFFMENSETEIYCTYRKLDGVEYLFVQNASGKDSYMQTFQFQEKDKIKSFLKLDLLTMDYQQLPLTVTLQKNESMLLFPSKEPYREKEPFIQREFVFENAKVSFDENYLAVDMLCYSKDGLQYSKPVYYSRLFQQLLEERYEGELYLKYEFVIKELPEQIALLTEEIGVEAKLNGHILHVPDYEENDCYKIDITSMVHLGTNEYEIRMHWKQNPKVYHILFEEDINSGFRNAFTYDCELEAIHLAGRFGVYSDEPCEDIDSIYYIGRNFYVGNVPERIHDPSTCGMPFFKGNFTIETEIELNDTNVQMKFPGRYQTAAVQVNGKFAGKLLFEQELDISSFARKGKNEICVTYTVGNRNYFGPMHYAGDEGVIWAQCFEAFDFPENSTGMCGYKIQRFFEKG